MVKNNIEKYSPREIESKWQKIWADGKSNKTPENPKRNKNKYILDMFPYPSGAGLHVGHVESYTATDIYSRYLRMKGFDVLHPQGFDAFGLPAENYAVKTGVHPRKTTEEAIETFKRQINSMGFSYDWEREVVSSDPKYYKWTQWLFLEFYKNGLAYKKKAKVNWCSKCQTVLANEQAEGGKCERCETEVIQKDLKQWFFKITDFIEDSEVRTDVRTNVSTTGLLSGLEKVDWPESTKLLQKNWIGKSEGATIKFLISNSEFLNKTQGSNDQNSKKYLEVFTTRLDTIYGMTYAVVAPEHDFVTSLLKVKSQKSKVKDKIQNFEVKNIDEIAGYVEAAKRKTDVERMEAKEKTGVEIRGVKVVNPMSGEEVPLYVADYVLSHYGTGAVMAVPAHDERDFEFAKKYNLPIVESVRGEIFVFIKKALKKISYSDNWYEDNIILDYLDKCIYEVNVSGASDKIKALDSKIDFNKILSNSKYSVKKSTPQMPNGYYWSNLLNNFYDDNYKLIIEPEKIINKCLKGGTVEKFINKFMLPYPFTDYGFLVNSGEYNDLTSKEAKEKMADWLEKEGLGTRKVNYKLRDWLVSRQRYWGAPIPIIYCDKCASTGSAQDGMVPVPEKDLPVELPDDVDFRPTGESPLKYSEKFQNVKCPKCGSDAKRESDTMDTFVCSSWYYLRYSDPKNEKEFASKENLKKWLPVDLYVGGAEHSVLHLLYSRFFTKVLHKLGYLDFDEPFLKLRHQGIILAEDGTKMSKSKGNVVNPDEVVEKFGADSLRMYEMFMGPLEDAKPWNTKGIVGIYRFLEKVWKLQGKITISKLDSSKSQKSNDKIQNLIHKSIKKTSQDIEKLRFNTAISQLMILTNEMEKERELRVTDYELLVTLLAPFAPHICEELWEKLGHKESIFNESWPEYDEELAKDEEIDLVVQVNGKLRDTIKVPAEIQEEEAKEKALSSEKIKKYIGKNKIKKIIFVSGRLINLVI